DRTEIHASPFDLELAVATNPHLLDAAAAFAFENEASVAITTEGPGRDDLVESPKLYGYAFAKHIDPVARGAERKHTAHLESPIVAWGLDLSAGDPEKSEQNFDASRVQDRGGHCRGFRGRYPPDLDQTRHQVLGQRSWR